MSQSPTQPGGALAIVLARAGSKGVPGKNAALVGGKPCATWTLEQAKGSTRVGAVVLTTDDPTLILLAGSLRVDVVRRPEKLATDSARVDDAARHAVETYEQPHGPLAPTAPIVILYANVPVRPAGLIDRAVELLVDSGCDSVQSYTTVGKHHPWWMIRLDQQGRVGPWEGDVLYHNVFRRQDLPPAYVPDGGVVALTRRALFCQVPGIGDGPHAFLGVDRRGITTPEGSVVDIDAPTDLLVADAILRQSQGGQSAGERGR